MGFRQHPIDRSSASGRQLSLSANGNSSAVRHTRQGSMPRLDTLEALYHTPGVRMSMGIENGRVSGTESVRVRPLSRGGSGATGVDPGECGASG